jgi:hypothetical protein
MVGELGPIENPGGSGSGSGGTGGSGSGEEPTITPNPLIPTENVNVVVPGEGSTSTDFSQYVIPDSLIQYLSASAKSKLLSASNIGASTASIIKKSLELISNLTELTAYLLNETILNNIATGFQSQNILYTNLESNYCDVIIILNDISPMGVQSSVSISNGTTTYTINISLTSSKKKLVFYNIPKSFVSNFHVLNNSGATFQNSGNSILIVGL